MAIYHYNNSPLLDRIEVREPRPGIMQATIVAVNTADVSKLEQLREALGKHNISTLMDTVDGRPAIQVRGIRNEKPLFSALQSLGLAVNGTQKEITPDDQKKKLSYSDRVRGKALFLSAVFYDLGNISYIISGIQRARHTKGPFEYKNLSESMTGVAFAVGDAFMTAYGHEQGDEELKAVSSALSRHLHGKGIQVPQSDVLTPESLHQSGVFKAADRWLRKHIIHVKCLSEFVGGLTTIHSGLRRGDDGNLKNAGKLASGFLITSGWASTFMLEKPRGYKILDGDADDKGGILTGIRDNPRNWIARPAGIGNNLFNLWGSLNNTTGKFRGESARFLDDVKNATNPKDLAYAMSRKDDYIWNVISAGAFIIGHLLFGLSGSKRPRETEDDKAMMQDLVLLSANVLAGQPEQVRAAAIKETAQYVSKLAHVQLNEEQITTAIRDKIASLSQGVWASRVRGAGTPGAQVTL